MDLRSRARVPYGYEIRDGKAFINEGEAEKLKTYFELYLHGMPMSAAATEAGLPCSATTLRNLLKRKEYTGTEFYPAIITAEMQERLIKEYEDRKGKSNRTAPTHPEKGVRIYKDFKIVRTASLPDDPLECAAVLYQQIRPALD